MECPHCTHMFKTNSSLKHHQNTALYCLKIQGVKNNKYMCVECEKTFSSNYNLCVHTVSCKTSKSSLKLQEQLTKVEQKLEQYTYIIEQKDNQLKELKNHVKDLEDKLENVAIKAVSRATTTNKTQINNYIQQLQPLTDQYIEDQVPQLTIEHIRRGAKGYAEYALKHPLNNRLICVDYSRRKIKYKDKDGNLITDPEMGKLSQKLFESIKTRNKTLVMEFAKDLAGTVDPEVQINIMADLGDYIAMVNRGADGEKTDLYHDFVKNVCSQSVME